MVEKFKTDIDNIKIDKGTLNNVVNSAILKAKADEEKHRKRYKIIEFSKKYSSFGLVAAFVIMLIGVNSTGIFKNNFPETEENPSDKLAVASGFSVGFQNGDMGQNSPASQESETQIRSVDESLTDSYSESENLKLLTNAVDNAEEIVKKLQENEITSSIIEKNGMQYVVVGSDILTNDEAGEMLEKISKIVGENVFFIANSGDPILN